MLRARPLPSFPALAVAGLLLLACGGKSLGTPDGPDGQVPDAGGPDGGASDGDATDGPPVLDSPSFDDVVACSTVFSPGPASPDGGCSEAVYTTCDVAYATVCSCPEASCTCTRGLPDGGSSSFTVPFGGCGGPCSADALISNPCGFPQF